MFGVPPTTWRHSLTRNSSGVTAGTGVPAKSPMLRVMTISQSLASAALATTASSKSGHSRVRAPQELTSVLRHHLEVAKKPIDHLFSLFLIRLPLDQIIERGQRMTRYATSALGSEELAQGCSRCCVERLTALHDIKQHVEVDRHSHRCLRAR